MTQVTTSSNSGFFGYIGTGGTVKNVTVTGGQITQNGSSTSFTGGIAGYNSGTIDNCSFTGNVNGGTTNDEIGGIAGVNFGTIINSRNFATITGRTRIGGIAGANQSGALIEYCYSTGNVIGTSGAFGIAGSNTAGSTVRNCVALCPKVTTSNSAAVSRIASASGTLSNNKARQDMKIGFSGLEATVPVAQTGVNSEHGADIAVGSATSLSSVFSGFDTTIWNINTSLNFIVGGALPTLIPNPQSSTTLPAAAP